MEQCNFCKRVIEPEKEERVESWGRIKIFYCPYCLMRLKKEIQGFNEYKKGKWFSIKEILKLKAGRAPTLKE